MDGLPPWTEANAGPPCDQTADAALRQRYPRYRLTRSWWRGPLSTLREGRSAGEAGHSESRNALSAGSSAQGNADGEVGTTLVPYRLKLNLPRAGTLIIRGPALWRGHRPTGPLASRKEPRDPED